MTQGGTLLLDIEPKKIEFSATGTIVPEMNLASNALSGLTINGKSIPTESNSNQISGGRLSALFALRDEEAPAVQMQLDAVARDLIERFEDPAIDPSLTTGDPGLFADGGSALSIPDELGLSGRTTLNVSVGWSSPVSDFGHLPFGSCWTTGSEFLHGDYI